MSSLSITAGDLLGHLSKLRPGYAARDHAGSAYLRLAADGNAARFSVAGYARGTMLEGARMADAGGWKAPERLIPFGLLSDMVSMADDPDTKLQLELTADDEVTVVSPVSRLLIRTLAPMDGNTALVVTPTWSTKDVRLWQSPDGLREAMVLASKVASQDDARPILTGVLAHATDDGEVTVAGTDSYRLVVRHLRGEAPPVTDTYRGEPGGILLPGQVAALLPEKSTGIELGASSGPTGDPTWIGWTDAGDTAWRARLIEGEFPNYRGLVPKNHDAMPTRVALPRDRMLAILRRMKRMALMGGANIPVVMDITEGAVAFKVQVQDVGVYEETLGCQTHGDDLRVAFNPHYLMAGVQAVETPVVNFGATDSQKPSVLTSETLLYLLMPVRVS